jgi:hypothetical protein
MATTAVLQANVLKRIRMNSTDTTLLARALVWLNTALDLTQGYLPDVEFMQKSEMTLSTVDGTAIYALPSDFLQLISLRDDTSGNIIDIITREQFDRNHPDPSSEEEAAPYEAAIEFDRSTGPGTSILRLAAIPDAVYVLYGIMRCFHPALSASQDTIWAKLQPVLEAGAAYQGALELWGDDEYRYWRSELKNEWLNATKAISQLLALQRVKPKRIRVVMKESDL